MIVYRLERNNNGPYRREFWNDNEHDNEHDILNKMLELHNSIDWPNWQEDNIVTSEDTLEDWISGCESIAQLKSWFGEFFNDLISFGFEVKEYLTDDYRVGDSGLQLIFRK